MDQACNGIQASRLRDVAWRKSHHSSPSGNCVEMAELPGDAVAVRNSRYPAGPALIFTRAEWDAFIGGARDGDFGIGAPGALADHSPLSRQTRPRPLSRLPRQTRPRPLPWPRPPSRPRPLILRSATG